MSTPTFRFAVAVEDHGHFAATTRLADRVLAEAHPWCRDILDSLRRWGTGPDEHPWHALTRAYTAARARNLKIWGHFDGEPGRSDASMVRAQLLTFQADRADGAQIDAVLLARDIDADPERALGFSQVQRMPWPFPVIVALCRPEVEAWFVAGFDPEDAAEHKRLNEERQQLGFSPPREPHRLNSKHDSDPKDAKAVLARLCGDDPDRRTRCLEAPIAVLRERGTTCGLADFLTAVHTDLAPVLASP